MVVGGNIEKIKHELPEYVTLVAAVKYATPEQIQEVVDAGIKDLGFNTYRQIREVKERLPADVRIHFIGHLQSNKVRNVLESRVYLIQSVDSYKLAERINRISGELGILQGVLLQVKTDENKEYGLDVSELEKVAQKIVSDLHNISLRGLMTIPPLTATPQDTKPHFNLMKKLYDQLAGWKLRGFDYLSMGMSGDYGVAVGKGANMVRIGSAIFK